MLPRYLDIAGLVAQNSVLLLGPRQTGKSTLLRQAFPQARYIDLNEADSFRTYLANP